MPPRTADRRGDDRSGLGPSSMNDTVGDPSSRRPQPPPIFMGRCLAKPEGGAGPDGRLLPAFGLRSLRDGPLEWRPAAGVERVHLLLAILTCLAPPGGGVQGPQLGQTGLLGREGGA